MVHVLYLSIIALLSLALWRERRHNRSLRMHINVLHYHVKAAQEVYAQACERHAEMITWAERVTVCQEAEFQRELFGYGHMFHVN